jgi:transcriptional regulator GlxA family with amidase domain
MKQVDSIAILGYDKCSEQDTITPLEIFRGAAAVLSGGLTPMPLNQPIRTVGVKLLNITSGNITMQMGTQVVPDGVLGDQDLYDVLYIPGGVGAGEITRDQRVLDAVRRHHSQGRIVAANCSGVGVLFRAGVLGDEPATCVAAVARKLRAEGADIPMARRAWQHSADGLVWTASGSFGINGATVAMVSHLFGPEIGTTVSMMFDTYGGLGEQIHADAGPELYGHPDIEAQFQDYFESMLLPDGARIR